MENTLALSTVKSECYQKPPIDETQKTMVNRKKDMVKHNSKILNTKKTGLLFSPCTMASSTIKLTVTI
jgi:hypothetical protein